MYLYLPEILLIKLIWTVECFCFISLCFPSAGSPLMFFYWIHVFHFQCGACLFHSLLYLLFNNSPDLISVSVLLLMLIFPECIFVLVFVITMFPLMIVHTLTSSCKYYFIEELFLFSLYISTGDSHLRHLFVNVHLFSSSPVTSTVDLPLFVTGLVL